MEKFVLNNGLLSINYSLYLSYYSAAGNTLTFRQNGGSLFCNANLRCAYNGTSTGNLDLQTLFEMNQLNSLWNLLKNTEQTGKPKKSISYLT